MRSLKKKKNSHKTNLIYLVHLLPGVLQTVNIYFMLSIHFLIISRFCLCTVEVEK